MKKTLPLLFTLLFALSAQSQNSLRLMTYKREFGITYYPQMVN